MSILLQRRIEMVYQAVTGSPIGKLHPSAVFFAGMASPRGLPAPSRAVTAMPAAFSKLRNVTVPATGSMSDGGPPSFCRRVRAPFHCMPVLATREPAVSSILPDRANGRPSSEESTMAAKLLVTSAAKLRSEEHTSELQSLRH